MWEKTYGIMWGMWLACSSSKLASYPGSQKGAWARGYAQTHCDNVTQGKLAGYIKPGRGPQVSSQSPLPLDELWKKIDHFEGAYHLLETMYERHFSFIDQRHIPSSTSRVLSRVRSRLLPLPGSARSIRSLCWASLNGYSAHGQSGFR